MSQRYNTPSIAGATRFSKSPVADVQYSRMTAVPRKMTTFNAGDIVPLACWEILPHSTWKVSTQFVTRLSSAVIKPTMGDMQIDIFAFFVPNRIVNESWKNVQGENTSGVWSAPEINLAPLYDLNNNNPVQIPVGSVADYYGLPTQAPILAQHLHQMNDFRYKGYLEVYNSWFRDENYQPPIPYSKLNIYNGFLDSKYSTITATGLGGENNNTTTLPNRVPANGNFGLGALQKGIYGEGASSVNSTTSIISARVSQWSALDRPLKANKLHDPFTSALPSPQKGAEVYFGIGNSAPVTFNTTANAVPFSSDYPLKFSIDVNGAGDNNLVLAQNLALGAYNESGRLVTSTGALDSTPATNITVNGTNLGAVADLSTATGVSINDLRIAVATQQVYETLARSGSRYLSTLRAFFELDIENPFADIPTELGHIRRTLDMYQVAQTSASEANNTAQGDLAAYSYTSTGGDLFERTFLEHGYVHILGVVRHRNIYSTMIHPDNFRKSTLDFYLPQFANIGEQPIRLATLNPFIADDENKVLGYQEAWWEYRYMPDEVSGQFRTGIVPGEDDQRASLDIWTYADPFDSTFEVVNGNWLKSNSQEVLDRTLAVTSAVADQFLGLFAFKVDKQLPMPTYSVPGLDTI